MAAKVNDDEEFQFWWENHVNRHVRHCRVVNVRMKQAEFRPGQPFLGLLPDHGAIVRIKSASGCKPIIVSLGAGAGSLSNGGA